MSFASEFREFAIKGNVMDLAVGVIIGAAFGKIVDSLVTDIIMPLISKATGGIDFASHYLALGPIPAGAATVEAIRKAGTPVIAYGTFLNVVMNFIILALVVFIMVRQVNRMRQKTPPAPPAPREEVVLLTQIRDGLARK